MSGGLARGGPADPDRVGEIQTATTRPIGEIPADPSFRRNYKGLGFGPELRAVQFAPSAW